MKRLNADARNFVDGIVKHLKMDRKGRRPLPQVQSLLRKVSQQAWSDHTAKVITAVTLNQSEKEELTKILSKRMNRPISLECEVRPTVLGGIRVEIADYVIDMSYEGKLEAIESMLLKGNHI
jgi:F-type H+-transporting ATPase subunit delta